MGMTFPTQVTEFDIFVYLFGSLSFIFIFVLNLKNGVPQVQIYLRYVLS